MRRSGFHSGTIVGLSLMLLCCAGKSGEVGLRLGEDCAKGLQCASGLVCLDGVCAEAGDGYRSGDLCAPSCEGAECGDDGCGGSCGECGEGDECEEGVCRLPWGGKWVPIPAGKFMMGCSPGDDLCAKNEFPVHEVVVAAFMMLETEVTQLQYKTVTGTDPSCNAGSLSGNTPVECVVFAEMKAFCEVVGGRLPTEAEWEYAARAGTTLRFYCGQEIDCLEEFAWLRTNSDGRKHDVKGKAPNNFGLYDMIGNVAEWVDDCWHHSYANAPDTAYPPWDYECNGTARVRRGGGYSNNANSYRISRRLSYSPGSDGASLGFRCARSVE